MNSRSISSSTVAVSSASVSSVGSSGAKAGSVRSEASTVCMRPMTAPSSCRRPTKRSGSSPSSSSASSQPSRAFGTKRCTTPKVASIRSPSYWYQPPSGATFSKPALAEEAQHLQLGVVAGLDAAEGLQHERVVEDHRGVRLLGAHAAHGGAGARRLDVVEPVEGDLRVLVADLGALAQQAAEHLAGLRVGEAVHDGRALQRADRVLAGDALAQAEQHLVDGVRAAGEARLDERGDQLRRAVVQRQEVHHADVGDVAGLGAEPAAAEQPLGEGLLVEGRHVNPWHRAAAPSVRRPP